MLRVRFWGVRGSFPCPGPENRRYGANTACISLEAPDQPVLLLDLGTGLSSFGNDQASAQQPFRATALVTHLHLDHVQGLPFFSPVHVPGTRIDIYGPRQDSGSLKEAFARLVGPPYFPVHLDDLPAEIGFHEVVSDRVRIGDLDVIVRPVPHCGPTVGYQVSGAGFKLAYISDHQAPSGSVEVTDSVLELCEGVDLLIHEAQYTNEEFSRRLDWGHCTADYALAVARACHARRLCLFHHDPGRSDDELDALVDAARLAGRASGIEEVIAAAESMVLTL